MENGATRQIKINKEEKANPGEIINCVFNALWKRDIILSASL